MIKDDYDNVGESVYWNGDERYICIRRHVFLEQTTYRIYISMKVLLSGMSRYRTLQN